jgi:GT2 family glycosyltransferase/glycosyltransferase involved in cell wall biosynthesis
VRTQAELFAEAAREAFDRAQQLLATDPVAAVAWLERASRFAPEEQTLRYTLGLALLRAGEPARAAAALAAAAAASDAAEAWLALASAELARGEAELAAVALAELLRRHALPSREAAVLARRVVAATGAAGWCGRRSGGAVVAEAAAAVEVALDGRRLPPARLAGLPARGSLRLSADGRELLGSPLDLAALRRVEGCVEAAGGGLVGWAWHPADPKAVPRLRIVTARGALLCTVRARDMAIIALRPLARPRRFVVAARRLAGAAGAATALGADGAPLLGSPVLLHPAPLPGRRSGPRPPVAADPARPVAVVVPVHGAAAVTLACLQALFATAPGAAVVVVDDASPEPELAAALDRLAAAKRILLLRHRRRRGFPGAANAGLRRAADLAGRPDVVLLNSDTLPAPHWLQRLAAAVHATGDIGTATPLSNDASIVGYPAAGRPNPLPEGAELRRLAAAAARANRGVAVEIPTAVGFCMFIRRECLAATGLLREDAFAQGYGEENDFCLRARRLGWRHVAVPEAFVAHHGGVSFGPARDFLLRRNAAVLEALHPGWRQEVAAFEQADPLAAARARLDAHRLRAASRQPAVLLITHDSGGGVEKVVQARLAALQAEGRRGLLLRPERAVLGPRSYLPGRCRLEDPALPTPNLRFTLPEALPALLALLRALRPAAVELHHLLGHHPLVATLAERLGVPLDLHIHDYAGICPRITLLGAGDRYCGEPDRLSACEACVAALGSRLEEEIPVAALRARTAALLASARRVVVPSRDAAARLRRYFPTRAAEVVPLGDDTALPPPAPSPGGTVRRVCVVGGIGPEKGYAVLLACARDAARRRLPLRFVVVGHTPDDAALHATGVVFVTGPYAAENVVAEIRAQKADLAFLPSVWPETWGFTLGEAWAAGLVTCVFDLGAPAERVRRRGSGVVLPLGLDAGGINNALLAVRLPAGQE